MTEAVKDFIDHFEAKMDECPYMKKLRSHANINPKVVLGVLGVIVTWISYRLDLFPKIALVMGVVLPAYRTNEAMKKKNIIELTRMSKYWVIFGILSLVEMFRCYILLAFPLYYVFKIILIGLILCSNNEIYLEKIYTMVVMPAHECLIKCPCFSEEPKPFSGVIPEVKNTEGAN